MRIQIRPGTVVDVAIVRMVAIANEIAAMASEMVVISEKETTVQAVINGIKIKAKPGDDPQDIIRSFQEKADIAERER